MDLETKYIIALTNLYGMVSRNKVIEIYNMQNEEQIKSLLKYDKNELSSCGSGKPYKECCLEDELDTSVSFLNQFKNFLTLSNDVIDVCQEIDIDLIKNVCDLCFEEFKDDIDDCEVLFTKLFNRIIDNNSDWNNITRKQSTEKTLLPPLC